MPRFNPISQATELSQIVRILRNSLQTFEDQVNGQPAVSSSDTNKIQKGLKKNDIVVQNYEGRLRFGVWNGRNVRWLAANDLQVLQSHSTNFVGYKTDTTAITAAGTLTNHFPNELDWGFYLNTSLSRYYITINIGATLRYIQLT